jgi:hypothetical protein
MYNLSYYIWSKIEKKGLLLVKKGQFFFKFELTLKTQHQNFTP